jgi:tetratricopeptide (TPR) repeat protein
LLQAAPTPVDEETSFAARLRSAETALREGRTGDAEREYQALVGQDPSCSQGYAGLARVADVRKEFELSRERWRECLDRFPLNPPFLWRLSLGWACLHTQRLNDAKLVFQDLARKTPPDLRPLLGLAYTAMRAREWASASEAWKSLIDGFPASVAPDWLISHGRCLENEGRFAEADEVHGRLRAQFPKQFAENAYAIRLRAAHRALRAGKTDDAELHYQFLAEAEPSRPDGFVGLAAVADASKRFDVAAERWRVCLERFPAHPAYEWRLSLAWALLNAKVLDEAGGLFEALALDAPEDWRPRAGGAYLAMRKSDWAAAGALWRRLIAEFPAAFNPDWAIRLAKCLENEGRMDEAGQIYRKLLAERPDCQESLLAQEAHRIKLAWSAIQSQDRRGAKSELRAAIASAVSVAALTEIFVNVPAAFEGWDRTRAWIEVEARLEEITAGSPDEAAAALAMRIKLALRDYDGFRQLLKHAPMDRNSDWFQRFCKIAPLLGSQAPANYEAKKVFGVGLARTGTSSLVAALETLGLHAAHYVNYFTGELLRFEDAFLFDAMADVSACVFFETAYHMFPNSKFIYTKRPRGDWLNSLDKHSARLRGSTKAPPHGEHTPVSLALTHGRGDVPMGAQHRQIYGLLSAPYKNNQEMRAAYEDRVRHFFHAHDPGRFLEFDMFAGDGWEKLCRFTECEIPARPFPHENRLVPAP